MATKDGEKTGGREAGAQNKFTGTVKETILRVFEELGGEKGLLEWVQKSASNKRMFYSAFMKMLPREVHLQNGESPESLPFRLLIEKEKDESEG